MGEYDMARPSRVGDLLDGVLGDGLAGRLNVTQLAARAWFSVAGNLERTHTMGLFVNEKPDAALPELIVYVDSNAIAQDLMVNREIYVARLEHVGFEVSDVQFRLSRKARPRGEEKPQSAPEELPELTAEEMAVVDELVGEGGDALDAAMREAMIWSMRRQKM